MDTTHAAAPDARNSGKAIWSLILGILSNFCLWILGSIPAIILGVMAIKEVDSSEGRAQGKGLALAGIITGSVGIFLGGAVVITAVGVLSAIAMPASTRIQDKALQAKQISDMRQISLGCIGYSYDNDGRFPNDLSELMPDYLDGEDLIEWSGSSSMPVDPVPYLFRGAEALANPDQPFLASPVAIDGKIAIGFPDGRVESVPEAIFEAQYRSAFPDP